nr:MAG TPA: hypothetical protein [Caudoviricetes sp.]
METLNYLSDFLCHIVITTRYEAATTSYSALVSGHTHYISYYLHT